MRLAPFCLEKCSQVLLATCARAELCESTKPKSLCRVWERHVKTVKDHLFFYITILLYIIFLSL